MPARGQPLLWRSLQRLLAVGLLLLAAGCVTATPAPGPGAADEATPTSADPRRASARAHPTATQTAFPRSEAEDLFAFGYGAIADRYIDPVDLRQIGLVGLQGLRTLDPSVQIQRSGAALEVSRQGRLFGSFPLPGSQDHHGWGLMTATVFGLLKEVSPAIAAADPEALYNAVFTAALDRLDPFSRYAGRDAASLNRGARNGFGGIGIMYDLTDEGLRITRVMEGTPAADAGLRAGDRILAVDDVSTRSMDRHQVRAALRGPTSSTVTLLVAGVDSLDRRRVTLSRALIVMPTVDLRLKDGVAFLTISSFNQRTTTAVAEALAVARRQAGRDLKGLVLDLRGNPGGLLDQAVTLSDLFMEQGPIVSTRGRHPDARQFYAASSGDLASGLPMVVLIDGESASAAEIVAAALQDSGRGLAVGTTSYGKGTVQTVIQLPNGGEITLTWSRFHSPAGYVLHGLGVLPVACTSGIGRGIDPGARGADAVISSLLRHGAETAANLALWRATDDRDSVRRLALRDACPAETHPDAPIDERVAGRLLADRGLYGRVLSLVAPQAAGARAW